MNIMEELRMIVEEDRGNSEFHIPTGEDLATKKILSAPTPYRFGFRRPDDSDLE